MSPVRKALPLSPSLKPAHEEMLRPRRRWYGRLRLQPNSIIARLQNMLAAEPQWGKYFNADYAPTVVSASVETLIKKRWRPRRWIQGNKQIPNLRAEIVLLRPEGLPPKTVVVSPRVKSPRGTMRDRTAAELETKKKEYEERITKLQADMAIPKLRPNAKKLVILMRLDGLGGAHAHEEDVFGPSRPTPIAGNDATRTTLIQQLRLMGVRDATSPIGTNLCKLQLA